MTADGVVVDASFFEPIKVSEDRLEGLLRTAAGAIFPGFRYFDFRPAIRCGDATRHPDGALLASGHHIWWVVEVETHLHAVEQHIEPQLRDLASGFYGPDAFGYLFRHEAFDGRRYPVDPFEPSFLLVIDTLTPQIRDAAARTGFQAVECSAFRSAENRYALTVSGTRPRLDTMALGPGLDVLLEDEGGVATLVPADGKPMPPLRTLEVLVGRHVLEAYPLSESRGIVLPLSPAELRERVGAADKLRLAANGRLAAVGVEATTILVEE